MREIDNYVIRNHWRRKALERRQDRWVALVASLLAGALFAGGCWFPRSIWTWQGSDIDETITLVEGGAEG